MLIHYLKVALRNLRKNKLTNFINIFGLGLSMSVGLMILVRTQDSLRFDKFHPDAEHTFRIVSGFEKKNGESWKIASTPLPIMEKLSGDKENIRAVANVYPALSGSARANEKDININGAFTEPSFFEIFGFKLISGDRKMALANPNSIVISRATAERFFGSTNVLGKTIVFKSGASFIVTGVMDEYPGKTHLNYDAYASYATVPILENTKQLNAKTSDWFAFNAAYTYVLLKPNAKPAAQALLNSVALELNNLSKEGTTSFALQELDKISPGNGQYANDNAGGTSWSKIQIEGAIALLILLSACFNYTNLTIGRALSRAKEVGVRKIMGARRSQVFVQYIVESVLLCFFSLAFASLILYLIVRYAPFNDGYEFIPSSFDYNTSFGLWALAYALFTGLLAGFAPAWILSAFKPLRVLKNLSTAKIFGKVSLQKSLIVFQYSLSLVVIIFLFVFYKQFSFMSKLDPGFKMDHVLLVPISDIDGSLAENKLSNVSGVKSVATSSADFTKRFNGTNVPAWTVDKNNAVPLNYYFADEKFVPTLHFELVAGRNFSTSSLTEKERYILINQAAAQSLGFTDAGKAIGANIYLSDSTKLEILGVLKDFRYENPGVPVLPLAFRPKREAQTNLYIETLGDDKVVMANRVQTALKDLTGNKTLPVTWLGDAIREGNAQTATISLLGFLGFITLTIATLGLLGLVVYTVEVKRKEISIRKVIGADVGQLVRLLSRGFVKLLFVAGLIAVPIGWFLAVMFIQNFSQRTSFTLAHALACFLFLLAIGVFAITSQTFKAARSNPADNLRAE